MQVVANQNFGRGADQLHIGGWNIPVDVDDTLRQNETTEIRENTRIGFRHREAHQPHLVIAQKGLDSGRLGHANDPDNIHLAIIQRGVGG